MDEIRVLAAKKAWVTRRKNALAKKEAQERANVILRKEYMRKVELHGA